MDEVRTIAMRETAEVRVKMSKENKVLRERIGKLTEQNIGF